MIKAVLLDIDGTLIDSNGAHAATWSAASARYGYDKPESFFRPLIGMGGDRVLPLIDSTLREDTDPGKSIASARGDLFRETYARQIKPTHGARALVEHLHERGLRCVIASSTNDKDLDLLLGIADVAQFVDERTTVEDARDSKPAPDIISVALRKAGVNAGEAIMLGDTPYDVTASEAAGVAVIALRCGGWPDADLAGAAGIYDDPADLLRNIESSPLGTSHAV